MTLRNTLVATVLALWPVACGNDGFVVYQATEGAGGGPGSGGGATGGTAGSGGDGAGGTGAGGAAPGEPRLIVAADDASGHGIFIWDDLGSLTSNVAPDVVIEHPAAGGARAVVTTSSSLFVATEQATAAVVAFDGPFTLAGDAMPSAVIPQSALPDATNAPDRLVLGGGSSDALIVSSFPDGAYLFHDAGSLTDASTAAAHFTHAFQQLPSVALDATTGRLISGQISGAGFLAWDDAVSATGAPAHDHAISNDALWDLAMDATRTYGAGALVGLVSGIAIWTTSALSAPAAPSVVLGPAQGVTGFLYDIEVDHDVLVVCMQGGGDGTPAVMLWNDAATISAPSSPDVTIPMEADPLRAELSSAGMLYVMTDSAILVFATPTTTPTLVTALTGAGALSGFEDLTIAE